MDKKMRYKRQFLHCVNFFICLNLFSIRQESLQATISEKDSTLALLELTSTKNQGNMAEIERLTQEKHKLQAKLREVVRRNVYIMYLSSQ